MKDENLDAARLQALKTYQRRGYTPKQALEEVARSLRAMGMDRDGVREELRNYGRVAEEWMRGLKEVVKGRKPKPTINFISTSDDAHEVGKLLAKAVRKEVGRTLSVRAKGPRKRAK